MFCLSEEFFFMFCCLVQHQQMFWLVAIYLLVQVACSLGSLGNTCGAYLNCLQPCQKKNCSGIDYPTDQPIYLRALGWNCQEECKYECMWRTVDVFQKEKVPLPQFHGKWPFVRVLGMQEPASVVFSILNAVTTIIGLRNYLGAVPATAPMFNIAVLQAVVGVNAWIWSSVYHSRDFVWTEILDYFCATSLVVYSFYVSIHRWSYSAEQQNQARIRWVAGNVLAGLYITHICYLTFDKFDYGYNMKANLFIGLLNTASWLWFYKQNSEQQYVWKVMYVVVLTNIFLTFEVFDFAPILWTFDAHSVWHMLTISLPILMFSFFKDDHLFLQHKYPTKGKVP